MTDLFLAVLYPSLMAAAAVCLAVPLRWVFRRMRLPAWLCVALWLAVLLRMLLPNGTFTSTFSLMRWSAPVVERQVDAFSQVGSTPVATVPVNPSTDVPSAAPSVPSPIQPVQVPAPVAAAPPKNEPGIWEVLPWVWGAGTLALWGYAVLSAVRLKLCLRTAVRQGEGQSLRWESDRIPAPFVFGLFRPKIYVPVGLEGDTLEWVLRHERAHLRLGHHWLKPLFFAALALHWFNPLLWLAWALFCRDLEMCCDERVLKYDPDRRKDYSSALLSLAAPRQGLLLPPGFGETGVKERIQHALRYQRPANYAIALAVILAALCICCLAADPIFPALPKDAPTLTVETYTMQLQVDASLAEEAPWPESLPDTRITSGWVAPYLDLHLSLDEDQRIPDHVVCTEYLVLEGRASAPLERPLSGVNGVDGQYLLGLDGREDSPSTGMETRLLVLTCIWESGADALTLEYAFQITLPSVKAGELLNEPIVAIDGQLVDWNSDLIYSAPYGTMLHITDPQGQSGTLERYASLDLEAAGDSASGPHLVRGESSANGFHLTPIGVEEGLYPDQTQYYTLHYTWEDGTENVYTFTVHAFLSPPELDLENMAIRYPGEAAWTDLGPLIPAPAEWANQDWAGRNTAVNLSVIILSGTGSFVDGLNGWFVCSVGHGTGGADTYVYRTHDGGRTWQETGRPNPIQMSWYPSCCYFLDDQIGFIAKSHFNGAEVFRTANGGVTWDQVEFPLPSYSQWEALSISFRDTDGLMVLQDFSGADEGCAALFTHDSGKTWARLALPRAEPGSKWFTSEGFFRPDPNNWYDEPVVLLGVLPEADISAYCLRSGEINSGLLLRQGNTLRYFPDTEVWLTPRMVPAKLVLADYDGDGADELAVTLCDGTGIGVSTYTLYLFEQEDTGLRLSAVLAELDLYDQINAVLDSSYDPETFVMTAETAGRTWTLDFSNDADWIAEAPVGRLTTSFYFDLSLEPFLGLSIYLIPDGMPMYAAARYTAGLRYEDGRITLDADSGTLVEIPEVPLREITAN